MNDKLRTGARTIIAILGVATALALITTWRAQSKAQLTCSSLFEPRHEHNGYFQINVLGPHPAEKIFKGEVFVYYPEDQKPSQAIRIERLATGTYARSLLTSPLVPFSRGLATPRALEFDLPTDGTSQREFPFDSPRFDLQMVFQPPIRPGGVIIRNSSPEFILPCSSLEATWDGVNRLRIRFEAKRSPFVRATTVIVGLAALAFAVLLSLIRTTEDLAVATASYFFSVWSLRSIVSPTGLTYSSFLDLWLMGTCVLALFVVGWRLTGVRGAG